LSDSVKQRDLVHDSSKRSPLVREEGDALAQTVLLLPRDSLVAFPQIQVINLFSFLESLHCKLTLTRSSLYPIVSADGEDSPLRDAQWTGLPFRCNI
jgi:hypothetical protein